MLLCLSFDHRGASVPLRERLAQRERPIGEALTGSGLAEGVVVLSTCNRFEAYLEVPESRSGELLGRVAEASGVPVDEIRAAARTATGRDAATHLFSVAAGLESAMVGEGEIAGQVRRAHVRAAEDGTLTHRLERLLQAASRTARGVKQRTALGAAGRSLVGAALDLAENRLGPLSETGVLLVGTGAYAGAVVAALQKRGVREVSVHSPSGRAAAFAADRGIDAVGPGGLADALARAGLVLACSRVEDPVLTAAEFAGLDDARTRLLVDLGLPRNIDPALAVRPGVELVDLQGIGRSAPAAEADARAEAERMVRDAADEFFGTQAERDALPALLALREHVLGILDQELHRLQRPAGDAVPMASPAPIGGGASTEPDVEAALRRFAGKLLHDPMVRIRALGRQGRAEDAEDAVAALFGASGVSADSPADATGS